MGLDENIIEELDFDELTNLPVNNIFESKKGSKKPIVKTINDNFDSIVEQLIKSKINVFFDENEQFKKFNFGNIKLSFKFIVNGVINLGLLFNTIKFKEVNNPKFLGKDDN